MGAEIAGSESVSFRVWAPDHDRVSVVFEDESRERDSALSAEGNGYFSGILPRTQPGALYSLRLDDDVQLHPDPASRFQPRGPDGPSEVIDPGAFQWRDREWRGVERERQVVYEMHIGTFTREGTWRAAAAALPWLADLGVTVLEVLPVAEFPGRFGWGYDGVHFFAPMHHYGTPDDMRAFVDAAHAAGLGVILDVVYNHCGAVGCVLAHFTSKYFSRRYRNEWGLALNYDDEGSEGVREFFVANAEYWIREFHLDGFRLDATQSLFDSSPRHIIAEVTERARLAADGRPLYIVAENEPQEARIIESRKHGGYEVDALWNDDFHHSARVAVTGRTEAYYSDYRGLPQEFVSGAKRGFLYQGQYYAWQKQCRGSPTTGFAASRFVNFLQNHDQVANSTRGLRLHQLTSPGCWRAVTALLLLGPQTPMLFQGQEFAASSPFLYFADCAGEHAEHVREGRRAFMQQFATITAGGDALLADPTDVETFERSKLDLDERVTHAHAVALHRDLLALRRDFVFAAHEAGVDGAVLAAEAFVLRFSGAEGNDRLLVINFGAALALTPIPEPLLAPPVQRNWILAWSSEDVRYGGDGTPAPYEDGVWRIPARSALVLSANEGTTAAGGSESQP